MVKYEADPLSQTFAALADPTRRAILERLAFGQATVGELAQPFRMSLPAISKHLRVLERAGLLTQQRRGRQRHCTLDPGAMTAAQEWIAHTRAFWEGRLDALDLLLEAESAAEEALGEGVDGRYLEKENDDG